MIGSESNRPFAGAQRGAVWILCVCAGLAAVGFILFCSAPYGIGLTPDAVSYIATARSIAAGQGVVSYDGLPFVSWPPLYPSILAAFADLGVDPIDSSRLFSAILFGVIVCAGIQWYRRHVRGTLLWGIGSLTLILSEALQRVSLHAWSEPLFILLVILFLRQLERLPRTGDPLRFAGVVVLAALACLTRYVGVTLLLTGVIVLLRQQGVPLLVRIRRTLIFGSVASLPLALWLARNLVTSGSLTGPRVPSKVGLLQVIGRMIGTAGEWILPSILGMALFVYLMKRGRTLVAPMRSDTDKRNAVTTFVVVYTVLIVISATFVGHDKVDHRLLSPIYVPMLLLLLVGLERFGGMEFDRRWRFARHAVAAVLVLWLVWPIADTTMRIRSSRETGVGTFSTRGWHESPLMSAVDDLPTGGALFSNAPDAVYIRTGRVASFVPFRDLARTLNPDQHDLAAFRGRVSSESLIHVAWFDAVQRPYLHPIEDLMNTVSLSPVQTFTDGTLYAVRRITSHGSGE